MSNFVVSARKYRPDHFTSVVGQQHVTQTLKTAIRTNQIAQAFLFCGPRGVGKTSCARILAKTLNCTNRTADSEACDVCESCVSFISGTSFNTIHELDAASNNTVDDIRSLVEQVRYAPQAGKYKIYIIDEVHMLSTQAFNAFLKTLEEPPSYAIFILATTEKHKIIPTILSRCQIFDFHRIQVADIARHLEHIAREEGIQFEPEALHIIAQKADGALRDALSAFDQISIFTDNHITYKAVIENLNILDYEYYFKVTERILNEDISGVLLLFDDVLRNGFNGNDFLNGLNTHFRELLVSRDPQTIRLIETSEQARAKYAAQSASCSVSFLLSAMAIGNQAELNYRSSKNPRLQVELALMKMCHIFSAFKVKAGPTDTLSNEKKNAEPQLKKSLELAGILDKGLPVRTEYPEKQADLKAQGTVGVVRTVSVTHAEIQPVVHSEVRLEVQTQAMPVVIDVQDAVRQASSLPDKAVADRLSVKIRLPKPSELGRVEEKRDVVAATAEAEEEDLTVLVHAHVVKAWKEYALGLKGSSKVNLHSLMEGYPPILEEPCTVQAQVENVVQRDILQAELPEIQSFLKEQLQHRSLRLHIRVLENEEIKTKTLFSSHDRFAHMAQKNPFLLEFRSRLELDLER